MKQIPITGSSEPTLVDCDDYAWISIHKWQLTHKGYAARSKVERVGEYTGNKRPIKRSKIFLHRAILKAPKNLQVDHINHNKLDNRRSNLRLCTQSENLRNGNKKTWRGQSQTKYKGVKILKNYADEVIRYQAVIAIPEKRISLGVYATEEAAARAYDKAASLHFKEFAKLNFDA